MRHHTHLIDIVNILIGIVLVLVLLFVRLSPPSVSSTLHVHRAYGYVFLESELTTRQGFPLQLLMIRQPIRQMRRCPLDFKKARASLVRGASAWEVLGSTRT